MCNKSLARAVVILLDPISSESLRGTGLQGTLLLARRALQNLARYEDVLLEGLRASGKRALSLELTLLKYLTFGSNSMSLEAWREVAIRIIGDIVLSPSPGKAMRKWREQFRVTQTDLASAMGVSSSVISDYESGRRRAPGTRFLRKFVASLIEIDESRGGHTLRSLATLVVGSSKLQEAVLDMREFEEPMESKDFCERIKAELVVGTGKELILGYTVVDSLKLVVEVPAIEYVRLYGATTQRAAIFTGVTFGRSPLVAVKAMQAGMGGLRPALVVMQGVTKPDKLAIAIAQREGIPLAICSIQRVEELLEALRSI